MSQLGKISPLAAYKAPFGTVSPPANMVVSSISGRQLRMMIKEGAVVLMRKKKGAIFLNFKWS